MQQKIAYLFSKIPYAIAVGFCLVSGNVHLKQPIAILISPQYSLRSESRSEWRRSLDYK
ncbi:MAG: hypothetical protein ACYTXI_32770 [Nostoc sp.]